MDQKTIRVSYVVNARLPGGGVGNVAYRAAQALQQQSYLQQLIASSLRDKTFANCAVSSLGLPGRVIKRLAIYDPTDILYTLDDFWFDQFAARHIMPSDAVHGWLHHSYQAKVRGKQLGATTILQSGSTHPFTQRQLLMEESRRWRINYRYPMRRHALDEIEQADYVIVPSEFSRDSFIQHGTPADRVILLPWGVDVDRFKPPVDTRQSNLFRVIYVGQVSIRKGIIDMLDAWHKLNWPEAELLIIGRPDPDTKKLLKSRSLPDRTRWLTHSPELWKWYHESDVFVFPSIEEGSALVTYEAMACGLPIVTTPNSGSIARDGQDGFIVPIRDVDALCDRLQRLRDDSSLREQQSRSARARAEQFSWGRYQQQLIATYQQILRNSPYA